MIYFGNYDMVNQSWYWKATLDNKDDAETESFSCLIDREQIYLVMDCLAGML